MSSVTEYKMLLKKPHRFQGAFLQSKAKRKIIRAGRRGGKTTGVAILAVTAFLENRRVLYAAPTTGQIAQFWKEVKTFLHWKRRWRRGSPVSVPGLRTASMHWFGY